METQCGRQPGRGSVTPATRQTVIYYQRRAERGDRGGAGDEVGLRTRLELRVAVAEIEHARDGRVLLTDDRERRRACR